ncbi:MAG: NAD(P)/FAD-dependent oxidoreductase, partial [Rhodoferax sp.]
IRHSGDTFTLESSEGTLQAGKVVLASDTRIAELASQLGVDIPVKPHPVQAFVTEALPPLLKPCIMAFSKEMFINQVVRGNFVVVCSDKRRALSFDHSPTADLFPRSAQRAIDLVPQLAQARVLRTWGGLYSVTPDMQPVLGESCVAGLYIALSSAKGFMTGPAAGRIMAKMIDGQACEPWVQALTPNRFNGNTALDLEPAVI